MHWLYLGIAVLFEIAFALGANATNGFTKLWPSVFTLVMAAGGIFFLSRALLTLDVGAGYAIWTGLGSVGIVLLGALIFNEKLNWRKLIGFGLVICGIIGLQLTGA
ncbi:DMT family transporter [Amycolatopsis rubida]|uniref:Quaternary ammonium compound-resistance protein SugE n=1 Tax=Amycolatopsis rubida TaxID=112413 RepID=A0A1I5MWV8_9PSEU|nr:multidrug efflux SMR transporter [Amycolatopsis rubida]SFP13978.1 quaternary ammonium compound-resistance protein SugE [Amycolatopsis rubida]